MEEILLNYLAENMVLTNWIVLKEMGFVLHLFATGLIVVFSTYAHFVFPNN